MDFINPERSLIKGVKSQSEADENEKEKENNFSFFIWIQNKSPRMFLPFVPWSQEDSEISNPFSNPVIRV
jgi:hypothetical protein